MNTTENAKRSSSRWWLLPVGLLASLVGGELWMVYTAVHDPGFAVEKDYYKKALQWDATEEQTAQNEKLGWRLALDTAPAPDRRVNVRVALRDNAGRPLRGANVKVDTFFNARAGQILHAELREESDGSYVAALPIAHRGLWEFRFTATQGGVRFTDVVRKDVDPSGGV